MTELPLDSATRQFVSSVAFCMCGMRSGLNPRDFRSGVWRYANLKRGIGPTWTANDGNVELVSAVLRVDRFLVGSPVLQANAICKQSARARKGHVSVECSNESVQGRDCVSDGLLQVLKK